MPEKSWKLVLRLAHPLPLPRDPDCDGKVRTMELTAPHAGVTSSAHITYSTNIKYIVCDQDISGWQSTHWSRVHWRFVCIYIRRKFRSQTSDNMDRWKAEQGRGREKRKIRRKKSRRERVRRKKMQMREKVGKSRNTVFFQWFVAPEGRKVGSLKRRVRSQLARWVMKKLHAVVARSTFPSQNAQNTPVSDHFGSCDVEKVHAVVARSTFPSQNAQNCTKHHMFAPLLEVRMLKKCTPLWREAHFEVKMYKTPHVRATFGGSDVEKVHAVVAWSTFPSQNVKNTRGSDHFWRFRCRCASRHYTTGHYTTLHSSTLHYTTLHSSTLHYTNLHYTTLHYTEWHCNTDRQVDS